jgi:DNA mismatch repair ATPase MutS
MTSTERLHSELHLAAGAAPFRSVLFPHSEAAPEAEPQPACFADLNLDQAVAAIIAGRDDYNLAPFFHLPLRDVDTVVYRQQIFADLEDDAVAGAVRAFAEEMKRTRSYLTLAQKQHYAPEKQRWLLDAAATYRHALVTLTEALDQFELASPGLQALRDYLASYTRSEESFQQLAADIDAVLDGLDRVRYTLRIKGARVTVSAYHDEADYTIEVEDTFARFREQAGEGHLMKVSDPGSMDHVEARIAQLLALLDPAPFSALEQFCREHRGFVDDRVARFDREAQFYLAYLEHQARLSRNGLGFCHPTVSTTSKHTAVDGGFDIALAGKLAAEGAAVVTNDFQLEGRERVLVVTGPNQGGKTTFARMFGQLHYLAALGVPVPGRCARLFLPDRVFAHFERQEDIATLRGKLDDELVRMREILEHAGADSVVVINEIFASTTLADAITLGERTLQQIIDRDCLAVCVTFIDELATLAAETVSMVAIVEPDDPTRRTFKIVRKPADGRAYAWALADKYGISYQQLKARLAP